MRVFAVIAGLAVLLVCVSAYAQDVIELKNGDTIKGEIIEETETTIKIKTTYGPLVIPKSQVAKVTRGGGEEAEKEEQKEEPVDNTGKVIIELVNGDKIKGEIIEESDAAVKLKTQYGPMTIPRSQIKNITKAGAGAAKSGDLADKQKELAEKHYKLGLWAKDSGLEEEAKKNFEAALKVFPDHEGARKELGFIKKNGEWVKGEPKKETPEQPEEAEGMTTDELVQAHQEAQQYLQAKEYEKALAVYKKILKSYPKDLTANYNSACLLSLEKRIEGALNYLEKSIKLAREMLESGTFEEQQGAEQILGLLKNDTDLDNLRDTERFKKILKIAAGDKEEKKEEEKPEKPKKPKKKQRDF